MANTVHGPYTPTTFSGGGSFASTDANTLGTQAGVALNGFNPDQVTSGYVAQGVTCVKDASTATQLDVMSGHAYLVVSDGTLARCDVAATSFSATGHASSTLYLDLNPDGSWSWSTSHSAVANHLTIASVTTDASSNIASVVDAREFRPHLWSNAQSGPALLTPLASLTTTNAALAATAHGGVTFGVTGSLPNSLNTAASFDGSTGYLSVPTTGLPIGNAAWSISARVNVSAYPATFWNFCGYGLWGTARSAPNLGINSSGFPIAGTYSGDATATSALSKNAWHQLVGTWDGTTLTLYVDGAVAATATPGALTVSLSDAAIGCAPSEVDFTPCTLTDVAFYGAALSSAQVTALTNAGASTTNDAYATTLLGYSPLRYYRLGDASGAPSAADTTSPTPQTLVDALGNLYTHAQVQALYPAHFYLQTAMSGGGALGFALNSWNGSAGVVPLSVGAQIASAPTWIASTGAIGGVGGQASAGSFGVPVIVAQAIHQSVTVTTAQTILSYTPTTTGLYRISGTVQFHNSASQSPTIELDYTDPDGGATTLYFSAGDVFAGGGNPISPIFFDGSNAVGTTATRLALFPITVYASSGNAMTCSYHDPAGTVNDHVSFLIERLA